MKLLLAVSFIFILSFTSVKQVDPLRNTKWDGANGLVVYFTASDTVKLLIEDKLLSSALYKIKDSLLTWKDYIASKETCDTSIRGIYQYRIKEDVLTFRTISDRCEDRANVIQTLVLTRK